MPIRLAITLALVGSLGGSLSAQNRGVPVASRLSPQIGAAQPAKYKSLRDVTAWQNPRLTIVQGGVEVVSTWLPTGRRVVTVAELHAVLVGLPVRAWPYGRVVAASDAFLLDEDGHRDEGIRLNHAAATKVLDALGVSIEWWQGA